MKRPRRSRLDDPTAEDASDNSTQSASGLGDTRNRGGERNRAEQDDLVRRTSEERDDTPRRYEQPADEEAETVMPPKRGQTGVKPQV